VVVLSAAYFVTIGLAAVSSSVLRLAYEILYLYDVKTTVFNGMLGFSCSSFRRLLFPHVVKVTLLLRYCKRAFRYTTFSLTQQQQHS
jgi:hypothetical protein